MGDRPFDWAAGPGLARATAADRARRQVRRLTALGVVGALAGSGVLTAALVAGPGSTASASSATGSTASSTTGIAAATTTGSTSSSNSTAPSSSSSGGSVATSGGS